MPCCPPDTGFFSAVFSNSCSYCTASGQLEEARLKALPSNEGNTGVPCCDPNDGLLANLFSNSCTVCNPVGDLIGFPSVPSWVFLLGGAFAAFVVVKELR